MRYIALKRTLPLALAAAFVAPLAAPVQADPPPYAPAPGYRKNKKNKNKDRDRVYRDDDYRDRDYDGEVDYTEGRNRVRRTVEGVVTRDLDGQRFELRADDGRVLQVRLRERDEPQRLTRGDRVRVSGYSRPDRDRRNDIDFVADRLQILADRGDGYGYGNGNRVSFPATVLDCDGSRRLTVRGDNGRTYTVQSRSDIARVDDGDRVRVEGDGRSNVVTNARVTLLRNNDDGVFDEDARDRTFEFTGTVRRVDQDDDVITVRDDRTGRSFTFRPRDASDYRVAQRVRATVRVEDGRATLTRVSRI